MKHNYQSSTLEWIAASGVVALIVFQIGILTYALIYAHRHITHVLIPLYLRIHWSGCIIACAELVPVMLLLWFHAWVMRNGQNAPDLPSESFHTDETLHKEISEEAVAQVLADRHVNVDSVASLRGPFIDRYLIYPSAGEMVSRIRRSLPSFRRTFGEDGTRMYCQEDAVVLEVHNGNVHELIPGDLLPELDELGRSPLHELPLALGMSPSGGAEVVDLASARSLIVAGDHGNASAMLNNIIWSLKTFARGRCTFAAISDNEAELLPLRPEDCFGICRETYSPCEAEKLLKALTEEMDVRTVSISSQGASDIWEQRRTCDCDPLPYVVVVMSAADRYMSDARHGESIKRSLLRIALCGEKVGVHCIISIGDMRKVDALVKANFQTRISFRLGSLSESMQFLDAPGAERLRPSADALLYRIGDLTRFTPFSLDL